MEYAYLSADKIRDNIQNLSQLTFEVTDACNLQCKYCGYGELYNGYDQRENKKLSSKVAFRILNYLYEQWQMSTSYYKNTYISFYGGEPLLNMNFIYEVVDWISNHKLIQCNFIFSMTTNGILLDKHIDYLVKYNFSILISLDGDEINNSYRIDHAGNPSFNQVYKNIKYIQNKYPDFFNRNVNFNAVLHNLNSYQDIITFFQNNFHKVPSISELSISGLREENKIKYLEMRNDKWKSFNQVINKEKFRELLFMDSPKINILCTYLFAHSDNVFYSYRDLLINLPKRKWYPTGTCLPFGKRMFVTVNGKILPCERIKQQYSLGYANEEEIEIDINKIADTYNNYYNKYIPQCSKCHNNNTCKQCIFQNPDLEGKAKCDAFMSKKDFEQYEEEQYRYLVDYPFLYKKLMTEVIIR